ncbi:hypothetical protein ACPSKX_11245 [Moritella viscosa]
MNYTFSRAAIIFTFAFSLSGCFDIADTPKLNSSWETTGSTSSKSEQFGFINDSTSTCPTFLTNNSTDIEQISLPAEFSIVDWNIYKQQGDDWRSELTTLIEQNDLILILHWVLMNLISN